jgi:hypothetical protein
MALDVINERTTAYLTVDFRDKAGELTIPTSSQYCLDCLATGTVIREFDDLPVDSSVEITLTPDDNSILDDTNDYETKRVTVKATYGIDDEVTNEFLYNVKNLEAILPPTP